MNKEIFKQELQKINIKITEEQLQALEIYYQLLVETNKIYNLTAITDHDQVYLKHFYDSLTITKVISLNTQTLCDIGTGAGFPGLVLKILFPNLKITLIEATNKKCQFLNKVITSLKLKDIEVINMRAEEYSTKEREKYDIVTCRAVAPLKHLLEYSIPLLKINGLFIPLKGNIMEEQKGLDNYLTKLKIKVTNQIQFTLPYEDSNRTIITFQKLDKTDPKYPRRYSEIKKKEI